MNDFQIKELEKIKNIIELKNGKCLFTEYINSRSKLKIMCKEGHIWESNSNNIKNGHWCNKCAGIGNLYNFNKIKKIVEDKKGICKSTEYINNKSKIIVMCEKGHQWNAYPYNLKRGEWCPKCASINRINNNKLTFDDVKQRIIKYNITCLSNKYVDQNNKMKWMCKNGHEFESTFHNIMQGHGCRYCTKFVSQEIARQFMEKIFNKKFDTIYPKWLINPKTGRNLELDGYNEELKIAFEYNGEQHYKICRFNKNIDELNNRKYIDKIKYDLCKKQNVLLIEIPYNIKFENMEYYIINKIKQFNINVPIKNIDYKTFNYNYSNQYYLEKLKEKVSKKNGKIISTQYINSKTKLECECINNHKFFITPISINQNHWCSICARLFRSNNCK